MSESLVQEALAACIRRGRANVGLIQRELKLGAAMATRLLAEITRRRLFVSK